MPNSPMHLTLKSLETEPIERVEEGEKQVRYKSLKLLSPGVWSDAGSQTATYYPPDGIQNLNAHYDESEHEGPPVNIMHDIDMEEFEAHEPSVAGHVDPDTLDTDDDGNLYGDIVFDTSKGAGQFADENLQSTLENQGNVGFGGPSVEIPAEGLQQSHDEMRDMPRVDGGRLTGVAMVMDPASKSVNFAREAARRPVALSAGGGESGKVLTLEDAGMSQGLDLEALRDQYSLSDDVDRETIMELADAGALSLEEDEEEEEDEGEGEEEEEEEEGTEMEEGEEPGDEPGEGEEEEEEEPDDVDALAEQVQNLSSRLEDVEDALSQAMTADDVNQELEEAAGQKLADAETVEELEDAKDEIDKRLQALEEEGEEPRTLADNGDGEDIDWSEADSGVDYDPATGSMSR